MRTVQFITGIFVFASIVACSTPEIISPDDVVQAEMAAKLDLNSEAIENCMPEPNVEVQLTGGRPDLVSISDCLKVANPDLTDEKIAEITEEYRRRSLEN